LPNLLYGFTRAADSRPWARIPLLLQFRRDRHLRWLGCRPPWGDPSPF